MLVHPWDAPLDDAEWRDWLLAGNDFGQLIAPGLDRELPVVVPTHFVYDGAREVTLHLARPNPVWAALEEWPRVLLSVIGDYTYVPSGWEGMTVPTSLYATVQLCCDAAVVDEPGELRELLLGQLDHFQPEGGHPDDSAYARLLPGIRGLRLTVTSVRAKFKYAGNKPADTARAIADRLAERGEAAVAGHVLRRIPAGRRMANEPPLPD